MSDIDSVGDENSQKKDKTSFVWKRSKNTEKVTPDAEVKKLIEKGGPGINEPLVIGTNLRGMLQVVPAMTEFDQLEQVPKNKCQTYQAHVMRCAKHLAYRMPASEPNDVALFLPSHDLDGVRRPSLPPDFASMKSDGFIDTIIAVGDTDSKGSIIDFFRLFNLEENGTRDGRNRISLGPFPHKHSVQTQYGAKKRVCKWKIMAADVPMSVMKCLYEVYCFGIKWRKKPNSNTMLTMLVELYTSEMWDTTAEFSNITGAAELVRDGGITLLEIDMTEDIRGTLDAERYKQIAKQTGFDVVEDSRCGKNCVKIRQPSMLDEYTGLV